VNQASMVDRRRSNRHLLAATFCERCRHLSRIAKGVEGGAWWVEALDHRVPSVAALTCRAPASEPLPGTAPLTVTGDLASLMVDGIDRFLDRQTELSLMRRPSYWNSNMSSAKAYEASLAPNRARLGKILGVVDERLPCKEMENVHFVWQAGCTWR